MTTRGIDILESPYLGESSNLISKTYEALFNSETLTANLGLQYEMNF